MRLLRCPTCRRGNSLTVHMRLEDVRCVACDTSLDEELQIRYFVSGRGGIRGPLDYSEVRAGIDAGTLRPEMLFSEEGAPWLPGTELPDLFPQGRGEAVPSPSRPVRVPRRRSGRPYVVPGGVTAMVILDRLAGTVIVGLALITLGLMSMLGGEAGMVAMVLLALGVGHFFLASGLRDGVPAARFVQLGLVALAVVGLVPLIAERTPLSLVLLVLILIALPVLLLVNEEANEHFRRGGRGDTDRL